MDEIKQTLGEVIEQLAVNYPNKVAMKYTTMDFCKTYSELNDLTDKVAKGLLSLGVKKGDHIAIWATNVPEWLLTLFGTAEMGGVLVTVNTSYKIFEAEYLLNQSDTKVLVMIDGLKDCNYVQIIKDLCPELNEATDGIIKSKKFPHLTNVIFAGDNTPSGLMSFNKLIELGSKYDNEKYSTQK
jgi:fatty-acyl-CoA synthase